MRQRNHRVPPSDVIEPVAGYLELTEADAELLEAMGELVRPAFEDLVERFYARIEEHPEARAVLRRSATPPERLRETLRDWLQGVFAGRYDEAWLRGRLRIGRAHLRIGLPQQYMFSAMNLVRERLHRALSDAFAAQPEGARWPAARRAAAHAALDRILDLELAIMLESYRADYVERTRRQERLANLGQFAAMIGHELRNPMAVMQTSLYLLRRKLQGTELPEAAGRHLDRLEEQLVLCRTIVGDLMEMARNRAPERRPVSVAELLERAAAAVPRSDHVSVELKLEQAPAEALLDPDKMRHLLVNLILNAVQSAGSGGPRGRVWVRAWAEGHTLFVEVADDGPGLPPELRGRLFEPLATGRPQGLGLGLALCQQVAHNHGGRIEAGERPGGGARFVVTLPEAVATPDGAPGEEPSPS